MPASTAISIRFPSIAHAPSRRGFLRSFATSIPAFSTPSATAGISTTPPPQSSRTQWTPTPRRSRKQTTDDRRRRTDSKWVAPNEQPRSSFLVRPLSSVLRPLIHGQPQRYAGAHRRNQGDAKDYQGDADGRCLEAAARAGSCGGGTPL